MAIAVVYIGQQKFDTTSRTNHERLFELLRTKYEINVRAVNEKDKKRLNKVKTKYATSSFGQGQYRSNQRERDKKIKK